VRNERLPESLDEAVAIKVMAFVAGEPLDDLARIGIRSMNSRCQHSDHIFRQMIRIQKTHGGAGDRRRNPINAPAQQRSW
jgi:hypothetical protein